MFTYPCKRVLIYDMIISKMVELGFLCLEVDMGENKIGWDIIIVAVILAVFIGSKIKSGGFSDFTKEMPKSYEVATPADTNSQPVNETAGSVNKISTQERIIKQIRPNEDGSPLPHEVVIKDN